ncbi:MAG: DUF5801 repeats-in-toxin domain-containing protein, partial [Pseudomonadota bacterium]
GLVSLRADVTVTDQDGDTASDRLAADLGSVVEVKDDVPVVEINGQYLDNNDLVMKVDERYLEESVSGNFANAFNVDFGADGEAAVNYTLEIEGNGSTDLVATLSGEEVQLMTTPDGNIEGRTLDSNELVLTVEVDENAEVTFTQFLALQHPVGGGSNNTLTLPNGITLNATAIDSDGDSTTEGISLGQYLQVRDDGPMIMIDSRDLPLAEASLEEEGVADFSRAFVTGFGSDGGGGISYELAIGGEPNLTDAETGQAILLSLVDGRVEGRTESDSDLAFEASVDDQGVVTLAQYRSVIEINDDEDDQINLLDQAIKLNATAEDGDGDSLTGVLNIGANLVFAEGSSAGTNQERFSFNRLLAEEEPLFAINDEANEESLAIENDADEATQPANATSLNANELLGDDEEALFTEEDHTSGTRQAKEPESSLATPAYAANAHEDLDTSNNSIDQ